MKKTLVALAAVSAVTAFAQSTVTVTGVMDAGYQTGRLYGQAFGLVQQNGARTTAIKFIGTEDLGGGLTAKFQFEVDPSLVANDKNLMNNQAVGGGNIGSFATPAGLTPAAVSGVTTVAKNSNASGGTTAAPLTTASNTAAAQPGLTGAGYSYVGLAGGFGEVQFGTINTQTLAAFGNAAGMFGTAVGGGYGSGLYGKYTRYENSMVYMTPNFNGFSARYLTAPGNNTEYGSVASGVTLRRPDINEIGLTYMQGPLDVKYAQITSKATTNEADGTGSSRDARNGVTTTYKTLGASYDFGVAKVGYGFQTVLADGSASPVNADTKAQSFYAQVPMGAARLQATVGSLTSNTAVGSTGYLLAGGKNTFSAVGVQYDLSKRSFAYLTYERATMGAVDLSGTYINGAVGGTTSQQSRNVTAVGISHSF